VQDLSCLHYQTHCPTEMWWAMSLASDLIA
jgi:hypothetical protein